MLGQADLATTVQAKFVVQHTPKGTTHWLVGEQEVPSPANSPPRPPLLTVLHLSCGWMVQITQGMELSGMM